MSLVPVAAGDLQAVHVPFGDPTLTLPRERDRSDVCQRGEVRGVGQSRRLTGLEAANRTRQRAYDFAVLHLIRLMRLDWEEQLRARLADAVVGSPEHQRLQNRLLSAPAWIPSTMALRRRLGGGDGGREYARLRQAVARLRATGELDPPGPDPATGSPTGPRRHGTVTPSLRVEPRRLTGADEAGDVRE